MSPAPRNPDGTLSNFDPDGNLMRSAMPGERMCLGLPMESLVCVVLVRWWPLRQACASREFRRGLQALRGGSEMTCPNCDGSGTVLVCCDDICRGMGECIHGDGAGGGVMGYIEGKYRLERGDVWRRNGPAGWERIEYCAMAGYPDEQGGPGYSFKPTTEKGNWSANGFFRPCSDTERFLELQKAEGRFFVGKWRGDWNGGRWDRNPEAIPLVMAVVDPVFDAAEQAGLWVRCWFPIGPECLDEWVPVRVMRERLQEMGLVFGPGAFRTIDPDDEIARLAGIVGTAKHDLDKFVARVDAERAQEVSR